MRILDSKVRDGVLPQSKGELIVDVRARDADTSYIIEVQRRKEPLFPRRAILYSSAEIVAQYRDSRSPALQPVHTLAFCDYDFFQGQDKLYDRHASVELARPQGGEASS